LTLPREAFVDALVAELQAPTDGMAAFMQANLRGVVPVQAHV
jgi:hypothetical protein